MEVRSRNQSGKLEPIYGSIAIAATKDKFLDFRNALTLAYLEDYAMLQGVGGGKHAAVSGIRVLIQDNTGNNDAGNISAIVPCYIMDQLYQVCKDNLYAPKNDRSPLKGYVTTGNEGLQNAIAKLENILTTAATSGMRAAANILQKKGHAAGPVGDIGAALKQTVVAAQQPVAPAGKSNPYTEFAYHQDRCNIHKEGPDGYCPVTSIDIKREQYRKDGSVSGMPWSFSIVRYEAIPIRKDNGTFYPNSSTKRNAQSVFINISDEEMMRCMYAVSHFISVWENTYCQSLVREGIKQFEAQAAAYRTNR